MGRRKADSKHIEVTHDEAEKRRLKLEREIQEDRQAQQRTAAAFAGAGTYLAVRAAQTTIDLSAKVPDLAEIAASIEAIVELKPKEIPDSVKKFLNADPFALGLAVLSAAMVLAGFDPMESIAEMIIGIGEIIPL